jgi:hypothetical protein
MVQYLRTLAGKISVSIVLFSVLQSAALAWGYSGSQQISRVFIDATEGYIYVYGAAPWANPDGCPLTSVVVIPMSGNYKDLEAMVLTAYASGGSLQFTLTGCAYTPGGNTAPLVTGVIAPARSMRRSQWLPRQTQFGPLGATLQLEAL